VDISITLLSVIDSVARFFPPVLVKNTHCALSGPFTRDTYYAIREGMFEKFSFFGSIYSYMKQPKYLDEAFEQVCAELTETFLKKHKDYGKDNILDTGELGIAFRVNDKLSRLKNLLNQGKKPTNESLEETWSDIGVYSIIALLLKRGWFEKLNVKK